MQWPISSERRVLLFLQSPAEGPMRGNALATLVAAAIIPTLGACSKTSAAADTTRGTESAAAASPTAGDSAPSGTATVPAEQLGRLHIEPVTQTSFRPTVQVTGTAQFDADVSTQVMAPISGPVMRILADVGTEGRRGQP